ncbi:YceD family protein [Fructilactobacillus frigidiflavus]|uniref:YceD family protein n=1 Tax=Fructilactobacillus frigidiflavus TaxID=3242688 RepID=UPI003756B734
MKWSFEKLQGYKKDAFEENGKLDLKADLMERYPDVILDATPFDVKVSAISDSGDVIIDAHVNGSVTVPSSRSLDPVKLDLDFAINEVYVNSTAALNRYEEDVVALKIDEDDDTIDFDKAVADNVIINIPMQVLSPEEQDGKLMPSGNDWEVISEDDFNHHEEETIKVDPRLASLKNFYSKDNDKA